MLCANQKTFSQEQVALREPIEHPLSLLKSVTMGMVQIWPQFSVKGKPSLTLRKAIDLLSINSVPMPVCLYTY